MTCEEDYQKESYRWPMQVVEIHVFENGDGFSVCPRCHTTLEREYQAFCDRCGQSLDWKNFKKAAVVKMF